MNYIGHTYSSSEPNLHFYELLVWKTGSTSSVTFGEQGAKLAPEKGLAARLYITSCLVFLPSKTYLAEIQEKRASSQGLTGTLSHSASDVKENFGSVTLPLACIQTLTLGNKLPQTKNWVVHLGHDSVERGPGYTVLSQQCWEWVGDGAVWERERNGERDG